MRASGASLAGLFVLVGSLSSGVSIAEEPAAAPVAPSPCPTATETTPAHCISVWVGDASGIRQLPDRCLDADAPAASAALAAPAANDACDPPTFVDARGIRRVRAECLGGPPSPAPVVPAAAVLPPAPAAVQPLAAAQPSADAQPADEHCDPPWRFDEKGIQRLRPECLNPTEATAQAATHTPPPPAVPSTPVARPSESSSCDPPWYVDARGIRRLRPNCL